MCKGNNSSHRSCNPCMWVAGASVGSTHHNLHEVPGQPVAQRLVLPAEWGREKARCTWVLPQTDPLCLLDIRAACREQHPRVLQHRLGCSPPASNTRCCSIQVGSALEAARVVIQQAAAPVGVIHVEAAAVALVVHLGGWTGVVPAGDRTAGAAGAIGLRWVGCSAAGRAVQVAAVRRRQASAVQPRRLRHRPASAAIAGLAGRTVRAVGEAAGQARVPPLGSVRAAPPAPCNFHRSYTAYAAAREAARGPERSAPLATHLPDSRSLRNACRDCHDCCRLRVGRRSCRSRSPGPCCLLPACWAGPGASAPNPPMHTAVCTCCWHRLPAPGQRAGRCRHNPGAVSASPCAEGPGCRTG